MPKDVVVVVRLDDKPKEAQGLDILLVSTEGEKAVKEYRSLEEISTDYSGKIVEKMAQAIFDQGKTTLGGQPDPQNQNCRNGGAGECICYG